MTYWLESKAQPQLVVRIPYLSTCPGSCCCAWDASERSGRVSHFRGPSAYKAAAILSGAVALFTSPQPQAWLRECGSRLTDSGCSGPRGALLHRVCDLGLLTGLWSPLFYRSNKRPNPLGSLSTTLMESGVQQSIPSEQ